ncbi:MAG TPA: hypothetical protein VM915_16430 [Verrucomicrobiae bacterium]|nr:hypothetical protein [Verrucomicrobiae bacterium]
MLPLPSCDLPAEFDPATYRRNRHDVDHYTDAELLAHYRELGVAQGTVASPGATRAYFLDLLARQRSILEIGPLANPIVRGVAEVVGHPDTYIDTHAWQFVPDSFREITRLLYELGYSSLKPLRVYDTAHGWNEFYAVLEKTRENSTSLLDPLPRNFDAAAYLIANPDVAQAGMDAAAHYRQYGFREGRRLGP